MTIAIVAVLATPTHARETVRAWGTSSPVGTGDTNGWEDGIASAMACGGDRAVDEQSGSSGGTGCLAGSRDQHDFKNWRFGDALAGAAPIPTTANILGIKVVGEARVDSLNGSPKLNFNLGLERFGQVQWSTACKTHTFAQATYPNGADQAISVGAASDLWGFDASPPTAVEVRNNNTFVLRTTTQAGSNKRDFDLDCLSMTVYWTLPHLYWKHSAPGCNGNVSNPACWVTTSGGTESGWLPDNETRCHFDASSFNAASQTVTFDAPIVCKSIEFTGITHAPVVSGSAGITVAEALALSSGVTWSNTSDLYCALHANCTLTTAGHTLNNQLRILGGNTAWTVADDFAINAAHIGNPGMVHLPGRGGVFEGDVICSGFGWPEWNWAGSDITIGGHFLHDDAAYMDAQCRVTHTGGVLRLIGGSSSAHKTAMPGNYGVAANEVRVTGHYDFGGGLGLHPGIAKLYLGPTSTVTLSPIHGPWQVTTLLDDLGAGWTLASLGGSASPADLILTQAASLADGTITGIDASGGAAITCTCCSDGGGNSNVTFAPCPTDTPTATATAPIETPTPTPVPSCADSERSYDQNREAWGNGSGRPAIYPGLSSAAPTTVIFSAAVSDPQDRPIATCSWNFGDGSPITQVPAYGDQCGTVEHTYSQAGSFRAFVMASSCEGPIGQEVVDVDISGTSIEIITYSGEDRIDQCLWARAYRIADAPCNEPTPCPVTQRPSIVHFSPYIEKQVSADLGYMVRSGYNVVHVVQRGQGDSCGAPNFFGDTDQGDLQLIDTWLAAQPWATGEYCLHGYSGPAILGGMALANQLPSGLKCAVLGGGGLDWYDAGVTKMGAPWPALTYWMLSFTYWHTAMIDPQLRIPPLLDAGLEIHGRSKNAFWDERDLRQEIVGIELPMLLYTSYNDALSGTELPYVAQADALANDYSAVFVYSGTHTPIDATLERPVARFPEGSYALTGELRQFFDHFLLDGDPPDTVGYDVRYAIEQGGPQAAFMNRRVDWATATEWPPAEHELLSLYFDPTQTNTISSREDRALAPSAASSGSISFGYQAPIVWEPELSPFGADHSFTFPDMRLLEQRAITFTSAAVSAPLLIAGPATIHLRASSDLYDWDWMVHLDDVWPDGSAHRISAGFLRASARNGLDTFAPVPSGFQNYTIPLSSVANLLQPGHRLRVAVFQANTTDATPGSATSEIDLTASRLDIYAEPEASIPSPGWCSECDPESLPADEYNSTRAFLTVGYSGMDESEQLVRLVGYLKDGREFDDNQEAFWGRFFFEHDGNVSRCSALALSPDLLAPGAAGVTVDLDCDEDLSLDYRIKLLCDTEGDSGSIEFLVPSSMGTLQSEQGRVQCYDTPFNQFGPVIEAIEPCG
ncbi:MAG TPA: CocE/NonD family hydrolase [Terriglobales bacterium]|nr:CocE/NonD family hydrolase [Terriglobales bacterium]